APTRVAATEAQMAPAHSRGHFSVSRTNERRSVQEDRHHGPHMGVDPLQNDRGDRITFRQFPPMRIDTPYSFADSFQDGGLWKPRSIGESLPPRQRQCLECAFPAK